MAQKSQLFELIKSLSRSEKGYFKKIYANQVLGKKNHYVALFDALDAQKTYDQEVLIKRFVDTGIFSQLPVAKNYLNKIILRSLRAFYSQSTVHTELNEMLINIEILYNKRLLDACQREIQKAEEIATQIVLPEKWLELVRWKKLVMAQAGYTQQTNEQRADLYEQEKKWIQDLALLSDYSYLSYRLYSTYTQKGMSRGYQMRELVDEIFQHPLIRHEPMVENLRIRTFYHNIRAKCFEIRNQHEQTHQENLKFISLIENHPDYIRFNLPSYVPGLYNLLLSSARTQRKDDFIAFLPKLKAVPEKYEASPAYAATIMLSATNAELFYWILDKSYDQLLSSAKQAELLLESDDGKQSPLLYVEIYYFIAYAYFVNSQYDASLEWLNKIINHSSFFPREDMLCYARILNLFCHIELGNERFVSYNLKSTYRFLSKMNKMYRFEEIMLSFLKIMLKNSEHNLMAEKLQQLRQDLVSIQNDPAEQNAFEYLDFLSWLDKKLNDRAFGVQL